jgi:hypothetical protein
MVEFSDSRRDWKSENLNALFPATKPTTQMKLKQNGKFILFLLQPNKLKDDDDNDDDTHHAPLSSSNLKKERIHRQKEMNGEFSESRRKQKPKEE